MIYFIQAQGIGHIKIGFTDGDPLVRMSQLQPSSPVPLVLMATTSGTQEVEKQLHKRFAEHRVRGEWFKPVSELLTYIAECARSSIPAKTEPATRVIDQIANAITSADGASGQDAAGGSVGCLTEAVMGITAGLISISTALNRIADEMGYINPTKNG